MARAIFDDHCLAGEEDEKQGHHRAIEMRNLTAITAQRQFYGTLKHTRDLRCLGERIPLTKGLRRNLVALRKSLSRFLHGE